MEYLKFVKVYDDLASTTKKLDKTAILASFLRDLEKNGKSEWIYLFRGRVLPDYDAGEFGISTQLVLKAVGASFGISILEVINKFKEIGDLGKVAEYFALKKRQSVLFSSKLQVSKVFDNLKKVISIEGSGAIDKKIGLISELLNSGSPSEVKYIIRTLLSDLRVGVADALLVDAIALTFFSGESEMRLKVEETYDLANDFARVFDAAKKGAKGLESITIVPGKPVKAMLAVKSASLEEAFEICGKPAALEHKYDGFRMMIHKKEGEIFLFTRRLENVTKQFPDIVEVIKKNVKGDEFILDTEVVGYDEKAEKYKPFESISQRIKRKYDIDKLIKQLPVEVNVFDVLYYNGESWLNKNFVERRKLIEKIIKIEKWKIRPAIQIITGEEKEAQKFYEKAIEMGEEGLMVKKIDSPYKQGRKVGYMVKLKPVVNDLDLVIVGAEYGTGKRGGWLTSYIVACRSGSEFLEVGKVSSGLKEKEEEGTTYDEMTNLLKPLIIEESGNEVKVKPRLVVAVTYQNIQKSPAYSSGYALRFPRISAYRPDRDVKEITTLEDIEKEARK
ncbi:MAG: ATP-dependent DNA ligase [Nanoarchaeota archaeon]|nr:ATP-dependent DNA ligase [Nanoarchaeota archaeon]